MVQGQAPGDGPAGFRPWLCPFPALPVVQSLPSAGISLVFPTKHLSPSDNQHLASPLGEPSCPSLRPRGSSGASQFSIWFGDGHVSLGTFNGWKELVYSHWENANLAPVRMVFVTTRRAYLHTKPAQKKNRERGQVPGGVI